MIILDTDHMTVLKRAGGQEYQILARQMLASTDQDFATTAVTFEEQMRGWLAAIRRSNDITHQIYGYKQLIELVDFFSSIKILPLTSLAADHFNTLRKQKIRIGTMDLKIASIALAEKALLLSANLGDFQQVPNLRAPKTGCTDQGSHSDRGSGSDSDESGRRRSPGLGHPPIGENPMPNQERCRRSVAGSLPLLCCGR